MQIGAEALSGKIETLGRRKSPEQRDESETIQALDSEMVTSGFTELLGILNYNQGLVEFADNKAGSLILLNSLLIAALGALPSTGNLGSLKLVSVILCSTAVYVCFQLISSKTNHTTPDRFSSKGLKRNKEWEQSDFLFFGCISKFKSGDGFCQAFEQSSRIDRQRAVLQRSYIISQIASRKFSQYRTAQRVTSIALVFWVAVNLVPFLAV